MPTAVVLLKTDHRRVTGTAERLLDIAGISEVYSVSGRYDRIVMAKAASLDLIECLITDRVLKVDDIVDSETMFALRSYDMLAGGQAIGVD